VIKNEINAMVKLFATLREGRFDVRPMDLAAGSKVSDVVRFLGIPEEVALIMIEHRHHEMDRVLGNGETLALFPPVGGG